MEYQRFGDDIVVRMDRGEEILSGLKKVCLKEKVKLASVSAIGAVDEFQVGLYDVETKKYESRTYQGPYEILSLLGNITTKDGEYYAHLHMACSGEDGKNVGGHLNKARISATLEMFIHVIDGNVERKTDDVTGLNVFDFGK